ncbi:SWC4 [Candida margitis]|uniref:SWC4 n=1 Tax=Candida margitis TaxID=1775924 RepID=UPI0022270EA7|nr:SWC4 [Candida margitis]KAI5970574.1 SWC4 [Candida margitis]
MSAEDVLDVLNIQRDELPARKKQKMSPTVAEGSQSKPLTGMARELYNLMGPNTPSLGLTPHANARDRKGFRPSPWTKLSFKAKDNGIDMKHWVKGSESLHMSSEESSKPYFFEKFNVDIDIPELVDEATYTEIMKEISEERDTKGKEQNANTEKSKESPKESKTDQEKENKDNETIEKDIEENQTKEKEKEENQTKENETERNKMEENSDEKTKNETEGTSLQSASKSDSNEEHNDVEDTPSPKVWTYDQTKLLFDLCKSYELKWPIIQDRFPVGGFTTEDLKDHFYNICEKIISRQDIKNQSLIDSLKSYSKEKEIERKQYLENLLLRTPAEIAEEESLVIEARRFELAAKKMLMERSNLLGLLDSPQSTQNVAQFQSSQGIANLYNNLMIYDKHQKKKQQLQKIVPQEPVPPPIPLAASSSYKRDRGFQTQLQQYLSSLLKQNYHTSSAIKQDANAIHQLLLKRLTQKEEEAYGLHYHGTEKLTPGVTLRSQQRLSGLQQKQSVLKMAAALMQELDIPTAGGSAVKPIMPTRKTMAKYDELLRTVVTLLDVKKANDKLESETLLIKSQRGLQ